MIFLFSLISNYLERPEDLKKEKFYFYSLIFYIYITFTPHLIILIKKNVHEGQEDQMHQNGLKITWYLSATDIFGILLNFLFTSFFFSTNHYFRDFFFLEPRNHFFPSNHLKALLLWQHEQCSFMEHRVAIPQCSFS